MSVLAYFEPLFFKLMQELECVFHLHSRRKIFLHYARDIFVAFLNSIRTVHLLNHRVIHVASSQ